jgi:hypothetical protein
MTYNGGHLGLFHFLERLVDLEILEFSTLFSDVHTPFTLTEHSRCEDVDAGVIPNESSTEKVKKWEQEKSSIFQNNIDIDKLNFIISKLENVDQQNVNQNYISTLVTDIGQVILDSAKQTFGVKLVNTNYSKKKKFTKGDKPWFDIESKRARQNYRKMKRKKGESQYSYNLAKNSEKEYKKVLNKAMKNYRKKMTKKMKNLRYQNTEEYWRILNQCDHPSQPNLPFLDLVDFFKNLNSSVSDNVNEENTHKLEQNRVNLLNERINRNITQNEIFKCIKNLKNNKACGDDCIIHTVYIHNGTFPLKYALRDTLGISNGSFVMKRIDVNKWESHIIMDSCKEGM